MNLPESLDDNDIWLCPRCSVMVESIFHCPVCKVQPPWGCDCADCQYPDDSGDDDDDPFDDGEWRMGHINPFDPAYDTYDPWGYDPYGIEDAYF